MFQDREEELEQQEEFEDSPQVPACNTDTAEVTPGELNEALPEAETPKVPSLKGYWIAVSLLSLGIVGVIIYWLILGGIL